MSTTGAVVLDGNGAPTAEAHVLYAAAAERVCLIRKGDPLDQNLVDYALEIVAIASRIADRYSNSARSDDTVGNAIKARFLEF